MNAGVYDVSVINTRGEKATLTKGLTVTAGQTAKQGCGCDSSGGAMLGLLAEHTCTELRKSRATLQARMSNSHTNTSTAETQSRPLRT